MDSPMPSTARMNSSAPRLPANPVKPHATDQSANAPAYSQRRLKRSAAQPIGSCISAYDQKNADSSTPFAVGLSPRSVAMTGSATLTIARSR
jgi:hypothetical protein